MRNPRTLLARDAPPSLRLAQALGVGVAYAVAAQIGYTIVRGGTEVFSAFWPASAIAAFAVVVLGAWTLPVIAAVDVVGSLSLGIPMLTAIPLSVATITEPFLFAVLARQAGLRLDLARIRDITVLLRSALAAAAVSGALGAATLWATGLTPLAEVPAAWGTWWLGDASAILVGLPLLLILATPGRHWPAKGGLSEALALAATTLGLGLVSFTPDSAFRPFQSSYLVFPALLWGALRFGSAGAAATIFALGAIALWGTTLGGGAFSERPILLRFLHVQFFVALAATAGLYLAAVIEERRANERELQRHRDRLEELVTERTRRLESASREMEAFSYTASHDLRAPLRRVDALAQAVLEDQGHRLDDEGRRNLERVRAETIRMSQLMDDLLKLSMASRHEIQRVHVDISRTARDVGAQLHARDPDRHVTLDVEEGLVAEADPILLRAVLENLLGNAWKFTARRPDARIEVGTERRDGETAYYVRDNGAGFDPRRAGELFMPFKRLHSGAQFEGTGIGLATVRRIVERHGGRVFAEARPGVGAKFSFTIPTSHKQPPPEAAPDRSPRRGTAGAS